MAIETSDKPDTQLARVFDRLTEGVETPEGKLYARSVHRGRFKEERNMNLDLEAGEQKCRMMQATLFFGRSKIFKPWAELYNIQGRMIIGNKTFVFFDSDLEYAVIELILGAISPGGKIFVEYENDPETRNALELGVPAAASRMGHILFQNGATWFKDWYFSEGFMEGGRKLQGEKAIKPEARQRHMDNISRQLQHFISSHSVSERSAGPMDRAVKRAETLLETLDDPGA